VTHSCRARFAPIAIVGRACVLPGALSVEALWELVREGRDAITSAPEGFWGLPKSQVIAPASEASADRAWSDRGGYVQGFEAIWDPRGFGIDENEIRALDPLFHWTLHCAREALRDAGRLEDGRAKGEAERTGAILGNLSFPTPALSRYAASVWWEGTPWAPEGAPPDPRNRFMSGLPALLLGRALGIRGPRYALDAACASSLYAIALACDALHTGRADTMLAGAVNRADDLFIHVGFCALRAMSPSGRSRPFHPEADGLVPSEGAAMIVLRRLEDALREGENILGVIRGVGLTNDGRGRGLLAPSLDGQVRAMRAGWAQAGLDPTSVQYIECHATGTPVGDATEILSMSRVFAGAQETIPIGSLKANLGHLVTVAGAAGLLKVLAAFEHGLRPPTPHLDRTTRALEGTPFEVIRAPAPWLSKGPRRAAVSAFGFGGNNAHLVVEEWRGQTIEVEAPAPRTRIAVIGVGARVADGRSRTDFTETIALGRSRVRPRAGGARSAHADEVVLALEGLRFPPVDLEQSIAQQTMLLAAAREAASQVPPVPGGRVAAIVGIGCDPEVARWGARWRLAAVAAREGWSDQRLAEARDGVAPALQAATVVGTMPNIPANRLNAQLDAGGPGFTISAEERSGLWALDVARRALERRDVDLAYVGASDMSAEPVHERAASAVLSPKRAISGDAAVVLALAREEDARASGAQIFALLDDGDAAPSVRLGDGEGAISLVPLVGHAHAASGLVHVAAAALAIHHGIEIATSPRETPAPWRERRAEIAIDVLEDERARIRLCAADGVEPAPLETIATERGPVLRLPAHPAPPKRPEETVQRMEPAPALPPVLGSPPAEASAPAPSTAFGPATATAGAPAIAPGPATKIAPGPVAARPGSAVPGLTASPSPTPAAAAAPDAIFTAIAEHRRRLGAMHQQFLARQAEVHAQFLDARARALATLMRGTTGAPLTPPVSGSPPREPAPASAFAPAPASAPAPARWPQAPGGHPPSPAQPQAPGGHPPSPAQPQAPGGHPPSPAQPQAPAPSPVGAAPAPSRAARTPKPSALGRARGLQPDPPRPPVGRTFDREALKVHAGGRISAIFGPLFEPQDAYAVQVRMPMEPMLLVDRVVGIDAQPGVLSRGTVWTETDITWESWYVHQGRMPAGILIEAGQADLFLISYMGIDFLNQGQRAYRLLGCELTYHRSPPRPGETIRYEIHIDGHAAQGDVRLFFFHYDCRLVAPDGSAADPLLTVRRGQAGFFTRQELDNSAGILWKPDTQEIVPDARVDAPVVPLARRTFDAERLRAFAAGDAVGCFGEGFLPTRAHVRTPTFAGGRMLLFDRVDEVDPRGGPWKRGYLKATRAIRGDDWFFPGHFLNDPCMPGTLMFEGCLQAMSFYLAAMGVTIDRDGWRFEPVTGETYKLLCRGQVTPESKELVYEIFVEEFHDGPIPTLYADLRCTVDGLGAFHARRMGLRLVPDWPISSHPHLVAGDALPPAPGRDPPALPQADPARPVARAPNGPSKGFPFDYASLLACAWGRPSSAFGAIYERFDGTRRVPRLPGPPYHFMSRVVDVKGPMGEPKAGAEVWVDYDVPPDAWYFRDNGAPTMPHCVLMEVALQPCGWLASYVGCALTSDEDLLFRNLDGKGTVHAEVLPTSGTLRTHARLVSLSRSGTTIIVAFDVRCALADGTPVYSLDTVFGFFPKAAFENPPGLPTTDAQRALFAAGGGTLIDLRARPPALCEGSARLPSPFLLMLDRVVYFDAQGGSKGLGAIRAEKDVDPSEWFFKAHFFQDPVQPGSLGVEAMCQLLQIAMLEKKMHEGLREPRFTPIGIDRPLVWKYRGQVVPTHGVIGCTMEIVDIGRDARKVFAVADASLWVDGKRIYDVKGLAMQLVEGAPRAPQSAPRRRGPGGESTPGAEPKPGGESAPGAEETLDPACDGILRDHCPTWVIPALPAMSMLTRIRDAAARASGKPAGEVRDLKIHRWITAPSEPIRIRTLATPAAGEPDTFEVDLQVYREARDPRLTRFETAASALVRVGAPPALPAPLPPLAGAREAPSPYATGVLFHGPTFQRLRALRIGEAGSSATLDGGASLEVLLDAATHGIPHDAMEVWDPSLPAGRAAYPCRIERATFHEPLDTAALAGELRVEARYLGRAGDAQVRIAIQILARDPHGTERVVCAIEIVEVLLPKGPIGEAPPLARQVFLRDRRYTPGVSLSRVLGPRVTRLEVRDLAISNWLPGTVERVYGGFAPGQDLPAEVAIRDHVGRLTESHPSRIVTLDGQRTARSAHEPFAIHRIELARDPEGVTVTSAPPTMDLGSVREFWRALFGVGAWPGEELALVLIERFVRRIRLEDPDAIARLRGKSVLFLANHQVGIESFLFGIAASAINGLTTLTLAKKEHRDSWLGRLIQLLFSYPGLRDPRVIAYFDRGDPASLPRILGEIGGMMRATGKNVMIHVEGTRARSCAQPVTKMSGVFCDLAVQLDTPIVPVRFVFGLPREEAPERLEFPVGLGRQDYLFGAPIDPVELASIPYKERTERVLSAINALGPGPERETPLPGDPALERAALAWAQRTGAPLPYAVILAVLASREESLGPELAAIARGAREGALATDPTPAGAWLAELARRLYGPAGPRVVTE
jgi:3-oxoacyl-(acyl-carrier-protein) synthase/3-hydroxymyristoyl/3-hydroxydecanoyl-(acyl carrier protein) dehydratase/1-acyl-sn-glycerol-3-phosphate acyltransferase